MTILRMLRISVAVWLAAVTPEIAKSNAASVNIAVSPISRMNEPWWRHRFEQKQAELRRGPVDLLWLGDSITQDWERDGPQDWQMFAPIWQHFYGDRHAVNLGFKGDSTCHLLWRLQNGELDHIAPRAIVLLIGANNFGHIHTDAAQTRAGINAVLDEIHKRLPQVPVLLLGVLPSIRSPWVTENTRRLNSDLHQSVEVSHPYVTYVDVGNIFLRDGKVDPTAYLDPHLIPPDPPLHPTAQAQHAIATSIEPVVSRMLGDHSHS